MTQFLSTPIVRVDSFLEGPVVTKHSVQYSDVESLFNLFSAPLNELDSSPGPLPEPERVMIEEVVLPELAAVPVPALVRALTSHVPAEVYPRTLSVM